MINSFQKIFQSKYVYWWEITIIMSIIVAFVLIGGSQFLKTSLFEYQNIKSAPFDGTVFPITHVPNWSLEDNRNKQKRYEHFVSNDLIPIPVYNLAVLSDTSSQDTNTFNTRFTYITAYMGKYMDTYRSEHAGSHLAVDIRAPLGTPVYAVANGVVVKVKDSASIGKYIVLRHDNVPYEGEVLTLYSAYLHLESFFVEPGMKITKGTRIGSVGITGITTTPHLHFQIDRAEAPFHSYWPFTAEEAKKSGTDFLGAVNIGLGREKAMKYTIHPMQFVQNNISGPRGTAFVNASTKAFSHSSSLVASNSHHLENTTNMKKPFVTSLDSHNTLSSSEDTLKNTGTSKKESFSLSLSAAPEKNINTENSEESRLQEGYKTGENRRRTSFITSFNNTDTTSIDTPVRDPENISSSHLKQEDKQNFSNDHTKITREKAFRMVFETLNISLEESPKHITFDDINSHSEFQKYINTAANLGIIRQGSSGKFAPNQPITRAQFLRIVLKASSTPLQGTGNFPFQDVAKNSGDYRYVLTAFQNEMISSNVYFRPNETITRAEALEILSGL